MNIQVIQVAQLKFKYIYNFKIQILCLDLPPIDTHPHCFGNNVECLSSIMSIEHAIIENMRQCPYAVPRVPKHICKVDMPVSQIFGL